VGCGWFITLIGNKLFIQPGIRLSTKYLNFSDTQSEPTDFKKLIEQNIAKVHGKKSERYLFLLADN
jgi:hypothetical protein